MCKYDCISSLRRAVDARTPEHAWYKTQNLLRIIPNFPTATKQYTTKVKMWIHYSLVSKTRIYVHAMWWCNLLSTVPRTFRYHHSNLPVKCIGYVPLQSGNVETPPVHISHKHDTPMLHHTCNGTPNLEQIYHETNIKLLFLKYKKQCWAYFPVRAKSGVMI